MSQIRCQGLNKSAVIYQQTLFDDKVGHDMDVKRHARRSDPQSSHEAARDLVQTGRKSKQSRLILERLIQGPATHKELAQISLKYTGRISDLRADGHDIRAERSGPGIWVYSLHQ